MNTKTFPIGDVAPLGLSPYIIPSSATADNIKAYQNKAQNLILPTDKLWKLPTYKLTTGSDTEYVQRPNRPNQMLTTQIALSEKPEDCFVFEHPTLGLGRLPSWSGTSILPSITGWNECDPNQLDGYFAWESLLFFAPSDLLAGLFNDSKLCRYIQSYCKQDARIRVETEAKRHKSLLKLPIYLDTPYGTLQVVLKVLDLGKLSVGGLAANVSAFGGKMLDKDKMDKYKTNMLEPYSSTDLELFQDFIDYAKDDACQLFFLRSANEGRVKRLFDIHDMQPPTREIVTTGSLVATLFQSYLDKRIGDNKAYELFDVTSPDGKSRTWGLEDMLKKTTVGNFAQKKDSRKAVLALVQGGRAKNELPSVIKQTGLLGDIDISGAYVTLQMLLTYPVGLPSTYGEHETSKRKTTLGKWLAETESERLPRLWVVVVSGSLNHHQTLVPSKVINHIEIQEKYSEDDPKIEADFRLYTQEVLNGVITSDVLATLKNTCNQSQLKSWMDLEVVAAAYYGKSQRCETSEEWYEKTKAFKQKYGNDLETKRLRDGREVTVDNRSRYWLAVPLREFLEPYANERKTLKKLMREHSKGTDKYNLLDAQQNAMKLVGNTNYGVLASPFFPVGNIVISNQITAMARVAVWATSMALGCTQTITDGGAYDLNAVRTWAKNKPTMNTLSLQRNRELLDKFRRGDVKTKPLADKPWTLEGSRVESQDLYTTISNGDMSLEGGEKPKWEVLDTLAINHVKEFFRDDKDPIELLEHIDFEHKDVYVEAVYHSQTNYRFKHATEVLKTKARGHKLKGKPYEGNESATIHELFNQLAEDPHHIKPFAPQHISQVLKCNQANEMMNSKENNVYKENGLLAGDSIVKRSWLRPLSLSMFHWQTHKQYTTWERVVNKLKDKTGWGLEQYYLNSDGTLDYVKAVKDIQAAIDQGKNPRQLKTETIHPYMV